MGNLVVLKLGLFFKVIFLKKFFAAEIPEQYLSVVAGREQPASLLAVVDEADGVFVVVERIERLLFLLFNLVQFVEFPDLDGRVLGATHEGVAGLWNVDYLVDPVCVGVQVRHMLHLVRVVVHLP